MYLLIYLFRARGLGVATSCRIHYREEVVINVINPREDYIELTSRHKKKIYHRLGGLFKTKEQLQNQNDSNSFREPQ